MHTETQSSITTFAECKEKYRLAYLLNGHGIRPVGHVWPFFTGENIHRSVASLYKGLSLPKVLHWIDHRHLQLQGRLSAAQMQVSEMERSMIRGAITGYASKYKKEIAGVGKKKFNQFEIPIDWNLDLRGRPIRIRGSMDMLGGSDKFVYIGETKSTSQISQSIKQDIELAPQTMLYFISYFEQFTPPKGKRVRILFNYIRKSLLRQKKNESIQQFMARVQEDYLTRPDHYYHREVVERTTVETLRFKQELLKILRDIRITKKYNLWYKNRKACNARGRCPFFDICLYGEVDSVMAMYRNKTTKHEELTGSTNG